MFLQIFAWDLLIGMVWCPCLWVSIPEWMTSPFNMSNLFFEASYGWKFWSLLTYWLTVSPDSWKWPFYASLQVPTIHFRESQRKLFLLLHQILMKHADTNKTWLSCKDFLLNTQISCELRYPLAIRSMLWKQTHLETDDQSPWKTVTFHSRSVATTAEVVSRHCSVQFAQEHVLILLRDLPGEEETSNQNGID